MGFNIRFDDIRNVGEATIETFTGWQKELETVQSGIDRLVDLEQFQGKTADSVKAYFNEVHALMMSAVNAAMMSFQMKYLLYTNGYYEIYQDAHAKLNEDTMNTAKSEYETSLENLADVQESLGLTLGEISDIFVIGLPATSSLTDYHDEAISTIVTNRDKVQPYEESFLSGAIKELETLIDNARTCIQGYKNGDRSIAATYVAGDYLNNDDIYNLAVSMQAAAEYQQIHQGDLEEAIAQQEKVYDQLQAEYEAELAAQRADQGTAQVIVGGLAVIVGVAAIVCTAGAATPVVVTAAVTGTCTAAYGVSEIAEGSQNIYYGMNGDPYTAAFNPIRDTVFGGDQETYQLWGTLNMTVASYCVPVGKATQGVNGVRAVKAGAVAAARQGAADITGNLIANPISNIIIDVADVDSQTGKVIVKTATGYAVGKGVDKVGQKYVDPAIEAQHIKWETEQNMIDAKANGGFAGMMDEADAARYTSGEPDAVEIETSEIRRDANASGKGLAGLMDEKDAQRLDEYYANQEKPQRIIDMEAEEAAQKAKSENAAQRQKIAEEAVNVKPEKRDETQQDIDEALKQYEEKRERQSTMWEGALGY